MRLSFIGGTYKGLQVLKAIIKEGHIPESIIILKEDEHEEMKYSPDIIDVACMYEIPYLCRKKLNQDDYNQLAILKLDFIFVCGWRTIIDFKVNSSLIFGMIAAHESILPKYRGFAPINWAILNGESYAGITLFKINNAEIDSGEIISQETVKIEPNDYAINVYKKITEKTVELCLRFIKDYKSNTVELIPQDESEATYTIKRTPEDGKINWNLSSERIYNLVRALAHPYPGAFCVYNMKTYHIRKAQIGENNHRKYVQTIPGRVIKSSSKGIEVSCGKGSILIIEWEDKECGVLMNPNSLIKSLNQH